MEGAKSGKLRNVDESDYAPFLERVGSLSGLFSDSETPLVSSRTAERLFVQVSKAKDLSRQDCSFDAMLESSRAGVGVKTFTAKSKSDKSRQKIAEFSKQAYLNETSGLSGKALAMKISEFRNSRVSGDLSELGLRIEESYYHCIVRTPGKIFVHEEPYDLIDMKNLRPLTKMGRPNKKWPTGLNESVYFTDGKHNYSFHTGKNTLYKTFDLSLGQNSKDIKIGIISNVFAKLIDWFKLEEGKALPEVRVVPKTVSRNNFVILPLYSTAKNKVMPQSGINQWNSGGRVRNFGESYIPIPAKVMKLAPGFFPPKDQPFELLLPNGQTVSAKVCQGKIGKSLMANPNTDLCKWLFEVIDGSWSKAESRFEEKRPYVDEDLVRIGKDSVKVTCVDEHAKKFALEFAPLGSYLEFADGNFSALSLEDELEDD